MSDIVRVIDAVLEEIPRDSSWALTLRLDLEDIRDSAIRHPEALPPLGEEANAIMRRLLAGDLRPWQQRVADIWAGRTTP